jgi:AraC-like DNA-binding protein
MKPKLLKISLQPRQSFSVRHDVVPYFYNEFHFHPEIELVHIIKGTGMQFVGNHLHSFKPDDMVLVGSNLPHLWKCDAEYFTTQKSLKAESFVIHFLPNMFGETFFKIPENKQIDTLLEQAKYGLIVTGKTKIKIASFIKQLIKSANAEKIIVLLQILQTLATSKELVQLNTGLVSTSQTSKETERMNAVLQFLFNNFTETIKLNEIASVANMSTNAFCRYFKSNTKHSFSSFLLELRINHACKLLTETDKPVADICFESGFNNLSNFNRYFKQLTQHSPLQYRNQFK